MSETQQILKLQTKKYKPVNSSKIRKILKPINVDKELSKLRRLNGEISSNINHLVDPIKKNQFLALRKSPPSSSRSLLNGASPTYRLPFLDSFGKSPTPNRLLRSKTPLARNQTSVSIRTISASPLNKCRQNTVIMPQKPSFEKIEYKDSTTHISQLEGIMQNCTAIELESFKDYNRLEIVYNDSGKKLSDLKLRVEAMSLSPKKMTEEE